MSDKEVTSKLVLQGDANGMVAAMEKAKATATGMVGHMNSLAKEASKSFEGIETVIGRISTVFIALSAGAGLKKIIEDAANWNIEAMKMSKTMGGTTEDASVLMVALHGLGIENDVAQNAALRLSLALSKGTDKFDRFGITVKDSNGQLLPMPQIMANVNQKLLETQSGADRNIIALSLYGRGWKELQGILRLTPHELDEARETAERLHLIVGPEGVEQSLKYKKSLHEVELIGHSLSIQLGNELMRSVVDIGVAFGKSGVKVASFFGSFTHEILKGGSLNKSWVERQLGRIPTDKELQEKGWGSYLKRQTKEDQEDQEKLRKLSERYGGLTTDIVKAKTRAPGGDQLNTDDLNKSRKSDWTAAHNKYLEYEKVFYETRASVVKIANDVALEAERQNYDLGLTDLKTFLETKHDLIEESLYAEVDAKKKTLADATKALDELQPVKDNKGRGNPSKDAENYHAALLKQQIAKKALIESEGKLSLTRQQNTGENRKAHEDEFNLTGDLYAQLYELTGQYELAAKIKQKYNINLTEEAQGLQAVIDRTNLLIAKQKEQDDHNKWRFGNEKLKNSISEDPFAARKTQYDEDIEAWKKKIAIMENLNEQETEKYAAALEERKLLTEKYTKDVTKLNQDQWTGVAGIVGQQLGQIAGMMNQSDETQFIAWKALASAQATISTALAITGILGSESLKGAGVAVPLAFMAGAIGAAQIGIIAGTQMQHREFGGDVSANMPYIVGERRPELFVPKQSGYIYPSVPSSGQGVTINQHFNITGVAADLTQNMKAIALQAKEAAKSEILNSMNRGGTFAIASGRR